MASLTFLVFLAMKAPLVVDGAAVFGFPEELFMDEIAPYLPTADLQSLLRTTPSMQRLLSDLLVQRYSM